MIVQKEKINSILEGYDKKKISIATICSHSALQIFHGAKLENVHTIGICTEKRKKLYESFPNACPDEFIVVEDPKEIPVDELAEKNAVVVPHGSFVEYTGNAIDKMQLPLLGNRNSLLWERDRLKMYEWMKAAGLEIPAVLDPDKIDRPCVVKLAGAKGGRGYAIVHSSAEFEEKFGSQRDNVIVQEYLIGVRAYPHYFYSPLSKDGYRASEGHIELMSIDRRFESNIDESYRTMLAGIPIKPSFTVVGNEQIVIRESLLSDTMEMGKNVAEAADSLFGGIPGPFCIETVIDENMQFFAFEISARIVAGTNLYPLGSPYSTYAFDVPMSMGRRIACEVKAAAKAGKLGKICY